MHNRASLIICKLRVPQISPRASAGYTLERCASRAGASPAGLSFPMPPKAHPATQVTSLQHLRVASGASRGGCAPHLQPLTFPRHPQLKAPLYFAGGF